MLTENLCAHYYFTKSLCTCKFVPKVIRSQFRWKLLFCHNFNRFGLTCLSLSTEKIQKTYTCVLKIAKRESQAK
jgi:hypothetical protein